MIFLSFFFSHNIEIENAIPDQNVVIEMNTFKKFTTLDLLHWLCQIADGMHFLALNKIVHRDLAARNVLLCVGNLVKISDFGLAKDVHQYRHSQYYRKSKKCLPIKWMAPETLKATPKFSSASDVWSYGNYDFKLL